MSEDEIAHAQAAYHEAGHTVLAFLTGICVIDAISLVKGEHAQAEFTVRSDLQSARQRCYPDHVLDHDMELAIIAAAGVEAERAWLEKQRLPVDEIALFRGAHQDVQDVRGLLGIGRWKWATARASYYLRQPRVWLLVEHLAKELATSCGRISGSTIEDLLHGIRIEQDLEDYTVLQ